MKTDFLPPTCSNGKPKTVRTQNSPHGEAIRDHSAHGLALHLFVRRYKRVNGGGAAPLLFYCGDVDFQG
jgi:hypothetical protein